MTSKYLLLTSMFDTYLVGRGMGTKEPQTPQDEVYADMVKGRLVSPSNSPNPNPDPDPNPDPNPHPALALAQALTLPLTLPLAVALTLA